MLERIKERYLKGYVRDDQLMRYVELEILTQEQAEEMQNARTADKEN